MLSSRPANTGYTYEEAEALQTHRWDQEKEHHLRSQASLTRAQCTLLCPTSNTGASLTTDCPLRGGRLMSLPPPRHHWLRVSRTRSRRGCAPCSLHIPHASSLLTAVRSNGPILFPKPAQNGSRIMTCADTTILAPYKLAVSIKRPTRLRYAATSTISSMPDS